MTEITKQSKGGQTSAIIQRTKAIESYNINPSICKYCECPIPVRDNEKVSTVRRKKFCNKSCAAKFNNNNRTRHKKSPSNMDIEYPTKYPRKPGVTPLEVCKQNNCIKLKTKGELFNTRKNWQSARSNIQRDARITYLSETESPKCQHKSCMYKLHVDVAHIKAVSEFSDDTPISEINHINNLMGLCKNHHWEYDHGYITLDDIKLNNCG